MIMMKVYIKIKLVSDDKLPLNKMIEILVMVIVVAAIFYEKKQQILSTSFLRWMPVSQVHQKSVIFVTFGIS